jgi:hypothetical protein
MTHISALYHRLSFAETGSRLGHPRIIERERAGYLCGVQIKLSELASIGIFLGFYGKHCLTFCRLRTEEGFATVAALIGNDLRALSMS